jgi:hypothetical protein
LLCVAGKIVSDATNPLRDDWWPLSLGEANSVRKELARFLVAQELLQLGFSQNRAKCAVTDSLCLRRIENI